MLSGLSRRSAQAGLICLMVLAAAMLWLGNPAIWLWIGSHVTTSQTPGMGPYALVGFGILASTIAVSMALARLNRAYERVSGRRQTVRVRLPWMRSLRDDPRGRADVTVLDVILVGTAMLAITTFTVWFLFFAGSPLPD